MKRILIVDDNQNNRMLIRALVEDYCEDNDVEVSIHEAVDGLEGSLMAKANHFGLIFMDIMMPNMDGIEATKQIRSVDSKTMIVAVSAVDDGERQSQILSNGAEDYISKPINVDIFNTRLSNYFSLIDSRDTHKHRFNPSAANVISNDIFSRKLLFYVQNEDDLSEFWEYYLLGQEGGCEALSSGVRTLYALGSTGLKMGLKTQIIVEESDTIRYMTITGIDQIGEKILKLILLKNSDMSDYKIGESKLTIRLPRLEKKEAIPLAVAQQEATATHATQDTIYNAPVAAYTAVQEVVQVYDYMDPEDLLDLREYVGKLNTLMLVVGGEIEHDEVEEISANLQRISTIATGYTDSYKIGQALAGMGNAITNHIELFMAKSYDLAPMCGAFGRDLSSWIRLIFDEGAVSVNYMDDTIIANAQTIESMLTMDDLASDGAEENLDDIFDF